MSDQIIRDRACGAIMGAFIGDALALGPHWYYNLAELRRDYGDWIDDYTDPMPGRYHAGLKAGQLSQAGFILTLMIRSLVDCGGHDVADFCRKMDEELFPLLDGTPVNGPGGYTSQSIRQAWRRRVQQNLPWGQTGGHADTTEAIERTLAIAVRYAQHPAQLAAAITDNTILTQTDDTVVSMTVAYCAVLGLLVQGHPLDTELSGKLMRLVKSGDLPFHAVTRDNLQPPRPGETDPPRAGRFASPDALLTPSYMAAAAVDPEIRGVKYVRPNYPGPRLRGHHGSIYRRCSGFRPSLVRNDFESAVLHAVNGGGQNQARAILTSTLVGAQTGISGIPRRFIDGLNEATILIKLAEDLASNIGES